MIQIFVYACPADRAFGDDLTQALTALYGGTSVIRSPITADTARIDHILRDVDVLIIVTSRAAQADPLAQYTFNRANEIGRLVIPAIIENGLFTHFRRYDFTDLTNGVGDLSDLQTILQDKLLRFRPDASRDPQPANTTNVDGDVNAQYATLGGTQTISITGNRRSGTLRWSSWTCSTDDCGVLEVVIEDAAGNRSQVALIDACA